MIWLLIGLLLGLTVFKSLLPFVYRFGLKMGFWIRHGRKGKFILFVYSDSSNWKEYIETKILPRIETRSIVLNWSKRREWGTRMSFETKLFNQWAGSGEFAPTGIIFPLIGKVKVIRLWQPNQYGKSKKDGISKEAEKVLFTAIDQLGRQPRSLKQK
ncbi:MAG: hypothetical protein ACE144_04445 [Thermodesulfobacteriota bacterium]